MEHITQPDIDNEWKKVLTLVAVAIFVVAMLSFTMGFLHGRRLISQATTTDTVIVHHTETISSPTPTHSYTLRQDRISIPTQWIARNENLSRQKHAYSDSNSHFRENHTDSVGKLADISILSNSSNIGNDSTEVTLPLIQRTFAGANYTAFVSGYDINGYPRLDSLHLTHTDRLITHTASSRRRPWSLGIGIGYGWDGSSVRPYAGITLHRKIFDF